MLRCAALVGLCLVGMNGFAAAACLQANVDGQVAQGQLTIGRAKDAAGRPERPYILQLRDTACLDAKDAEDAVKSTRTIHVFPADEALQPTFNRLVGKTVIVHGNPFPRMTAHHHAPIVMQVTRIEPQ
jgi:hypothetical protein